MSPFYGLPEELLVMIVEHLAPVPDLANHHERSFESLKALRCTCKFFAGLRGLQAILFRDIRLEASPDHLDVLRSTEDLTWLTPFVRRIEFIPWKYSWAMDEASFGSIFTSRKLHALCLQRGIGPSELTDLYHEEIVQTYLEGVWPTEDGDQRRWWAIYMAHAQCTKNLFATKQIEDAWTKVLLKFPFVYEFRVGTWNCDAEEVIQRADYDFRAHSHTEEHRPYVCDAVQRPVSEAVFSAAIAALTKAKSSVRRLDVAHLTDWKMRWAGNGGLEGMDLSKLEALLFRPQNALSADSSPAVNSDRQGWEDSLFHEEIRGGQVALQLIRPCHRTLKHLVLSSPGAEPFNPAYYPPKDIAILPNLESLSIGGNVRLASLANFIHRCTKLRSLELYPADDAFGRWRDVWRAVRHHPNNLLLDCEVLAEDLGLFKLKSYVRGREDTEGEQYVSWRNDDKQDRFYVPSSVRESLVKYICRRGRWNKECKRAFPSFDQVEEKDSVQEYGEEDSMQDLISSDESERSFEAVSDERDWLDA